MDLSKWQNMDPHLLVGLVNTELRNQSESLDDLVKSHDISEEKLIQKLRAAGYEFREEQKQFR
jgi:biotin operon repressor